MTNKKCIVVENFASLEGARDYANKNDCGIYHSPDAPENGYAVVKWVPVAGRLNGTYVYQSWESDLDA